jgi:serine/threonine-protein kinase
VKPANLFLAGDTVKVIDFGLAKLAFDVGDSRSTLAVGTPLFMAPEQIEGGVPVTPACDRYALAQVAYCALVGRPFWEREARETDGVFPLLLRIAAGARDAASARARRAGVDLPSEFDDWFARATARSPHDRFDSAGEMVDELARIHAISAPARLAAPQATTIRATHPSLRPDGPGRALRTAVVALGIAGGVAGIVRASTSAAGGVSPSELAPQALRGAPLAPRAAQEPATPTEQAQGASSVVPPAAASSVEPKTKSATRGPVTQDAPVRVAPSSRATRGAAPRPIPSGAPAHTPTLDSPW